MKILALMMFVTLLASSAFANETATPIEDIKRGTMVTVSGVVERITDEDEFRLTDASGSVRIYVGPNWVPANVGEAVTVNGFVDNGFGLTEIYARSLTRQDGTVINFEHLYD